MGSDLLVGFLKIFLKDPDLVLHCADQALHLGVGLLLEDFLDPFWRLRRLLPWFGVLISGPQRLGSDPML